MKSVFGRSLCIFALAIALSPTPGLGGEGDAYPDAGEPPVGGNEEGGGAPRFAVHVEPGPVRTAVLHADGRVLQLPTETVWRPMCGSVPGSITTEDLRQLAAQWRQRIEQLEERPRAQGGGGLDVFFNLDASVPGASFNSFVKIETYLEALFPSDDAFVEILVSFAALPSGVLGQAASFRTTASWQNVIRPGLQADADSNDEILNWLPAGSTIPVRYSTGSTITNEDRVFVTIANFQAAIGSIGGPSAVMTFSTNFTWDYTPPDIQGFGFQSVLAHEMGHALGFVSRADRNEPDIEMLDIFRFQSTDGGPANDYNPDTFQEFQVRPRFVDLNDDDNANSDLISVEYAMADGIPFQASHFREEFPTIGVMDPAIGAGQTFFPDFFMQSDEDMFDAIGWDLPPVPIESDPPTPNPMFFDTPPAPFDQFTLVMIATTATDSSPPVQYKFDVITGSGTSSGWQESTIYVDFSLSANTQSQYTVRARDTTTTQNETAPSDPFSAYTLAFTPSAPSVSGETSTTIDVDPTAGANPPDTELAIRVETTDLNWDQMFVDISGNPSASKTWRTDADWGTIVVQGLLGSTSYDFSVQARNGDGILTNFSPATTGTTAVASACCDHGLPGGQCVSEGGTESECLNDPSLIQPEWFENLHCADLSTLCDEHTGACCDKSQPGGVCTNNVPESQCNPTGDPQIQWFKGETCSPGGTVVCDEHTGACCDNALPPGSQCLGILAESDCLDQGTQTKFFKDGTCDDCAQPCLAPVVISGISSRYIQIEPDPSNADAVAFHIECGTDGASPNEGWVQLILTDYPEDPAGTVLVNIGKTTPNCADADFLTAAQWTSNGANALYVTGLAVCPSFAALADGGPISRPTVTARCVDCASPDADAVQPAAPTWVYCDSSGDGQTTFFSDLFKQFSNTAAAGGPAFTGPDAGIEVDTQGNWKDVADQQVTFFSDIFQCFGATAAGGGDTWDGPTCP
ncbi:MAG: NF038122 family metalloprotease [Phycisphaerae bacterium]